MKKNQMGFSLAGGILLFVIVGIIGGTGYYVYSQNKQDKKTAETSIPTATQSKKEIKAPDYIELKKMGVKIESNADTGSFKIAEYDASPGKNGVLTDRAYIVVNNEEVIEAFKTCYAKAKQYPLAERNKQINEVEKNAGVIVVRDQGGFNKPYDLEGPGSVEIVKKFPNFSLAVGRSSQSCQVNINGNPGTDKNVESSLNNLLKQVNRAFSEASEI